MRNGLSIFHRQTSHGSRSPILAAGLLLSLAAAAPGQTAPAASTAQAASKYFANRLVDDARGILRQTNVPADLSAKEASILLQYAVSLDATPDAAGIATSDPRILRLLAEATRVTGESAVRRDTLRKLIAADKGDLVAQVQYLDFLAGDAQQLEDRAKIYQSALDSSALDAQIRSEMALRLAGIAHERNDTDTETALYKQAVALNPVNLAGLRGLVRLAAADAKNVPGQVAALNNLLNASPYQPDAWIQLARLCENANLHDRAADFLQAALEQTSIQGAPPSGSLYLEFGIELAIAGRRAEAFNIINALAKLPDAPLSALVFAEYLAQTDIPGVNTAAGAATRPEKEMAADRLQKALDDLAKGGATEGGNPHDFADAAAIALAVLPDQPKIAEWVDAYAKLVPENDPVLARLKAWQLFRNAGKEEAKLEEARAAFQKIADSDPMGQLGLANLALDEQKTADAGKILQDVWSGHPTGIIAFQAAQLARKANFTLADTQLTRDLRAQIRIPASALVAHRVPREMELLNVNIRRLSVGLGEPLLLTLRINNPTDKPQPVGGTSNEGVIITSVGLAAGTRGTSQVNIGMFAVEDLQRVYRLEPHANIETIIRVDQGKLADILERAPLRNFMLTLSIATAPYSPNGKDMIAGLGGQLIQVGDVERAGTPPELDKLKNDINTLTGDRQLIRISMACALLGSLGPTTKPAATAAAGAGTATQEAAALQSLQEMLLPLAKSPDALVRAAFIRALPAAYVSDELDQAALMLMSDGDPLVRVLAAAQQGVIAGQSGGAGARVKAAANSLNDRLATETDVMVKQWVSLMLDQAKATAATPATSTAPATGPASRP